MRLRGGARSAVGHTVPDAWEGKLTELERATRSPKKSRAPRTSLAGRQRSRAIRRRGPALVAALCAVVAVMVAADHLANAGEIRRGVQVGGVSLGGKMPGEARNILQERAEAVGDIRLDGPANATLGADLLSLDYDVAATVEQAYAVGRRGDVARRLADRARTVFSTVRVEPVAE